MKSRKWNLTINNHEEKGFTPTIVKDILNNQQCRYYCFAEEIGDNGTKHIHIYIYFKNPRSFGGVQSLFKSAHIENALGTSEENREYILKGDKHKEKQHTKIEGSFYEFGDVPIEQKGKRTDLEVLVELVKDGNSLLEIIEYNPNYLKYTKHIKELSNLYAKAKYEEVFRELDVTYIYGTSGSGKSSYVMNKHGYKNVYRVTDYEHPFDSYDNQDIILFDEFRNDLKIKDMLKYLDGYPCELPCRYENKWACFHKVYIISNIPIESQYVNVQENEMETYKAFRRRIHHYANFFDNIKYYYDDFDLYVHGIGSLIDTCIS